MIAVYTYYITMVIELKPKFWKIPYRNFEIPPEKSQDF
jgi:hypothetical protein